MWNLNQINHRKLGQFEQKKLVQEEGKTHEKNKYETRHTFLDIQTLKISSKRIFQIYYIKWMNYDLSYS